MSVLVGKPAPLFRAKAVAGTTIIEDFSLEQFKGQSYVVLFFYPKDFTFVCPTELHRFQEELGEFKKRHVEVVGARRIPSLPTGRGCKRRASRGAFRA